MARHPLRVADDTPPATPRSKRRRRVLHTAGLSASAAVLALSIQAGSLSSDDEPPANQYGDATILDPDDTGADSSEP
jgi:hypothetical protein